MKKKKEECALSRSFRIAHTLTNTEFYLSFCGDTDIGPIYDQWGFRDLSITVNPPTPSPVKCVCVCVCVCAFFF